MEEGSAEPSLEVLVGKCSKPLKGEDMSVTCEAIIGGDPFILALVADGHGGKTASSHVARHALKRLVEKAKGGSACALDDAAAEVFREMHAEIRAIPDCELAPSSDTAQPATDLLVTLIPPSPRPPTSLPAPSGNAGSTLTVVAINLARSELSTWNAGDSTAVIALGEGGQLERSHSASDDADETSDPESCSSTPPGLSERTIELGKSHRLENSQEEVDRVMHVGGTVGQAMSDEGKPVGPLRAWPGGLAVTRGVGDADCGDIVSPDPDHSTYSLPDEGGVVLICSDGVWDAPIEPQEAASFVLEGSFSSPDKAAAELVQRAISKRGLRDDTTAVLLFFGASGSSSASHSARPRRRSLVGRLKSSLTITQPSLRPESPDSPPSTSIVSSPAPAPVLKVGVPLSAGPISGAGLCMDASVKGGTLFSDLGSGRRGRASSPACRAFSPSRRRTGPLFRLPSRNRSPTNSDSA